MRFCHIEEPRRKQRVKLIRRADLLQTSVLMRNEDNHRPIEKLLET